VGGGATSKTIRQAKLTASHAKRRMTLRRYWIPTHSIEGNQVRLRGDVLHHIRDVCRMRVGSKFEVIMEGGVAHLVQITTESKAESVAEILETRQIAALPEPHVHLALSIPRFPVFEAVLEKAVELGVATVHPFFSDYSFIRTQADVWEKKRARFQKIIESATQQSGRGELMKLSEPVELGLLLKTFNRSGSARGLFAYEGESRLSARDGIEALRADSPREIWPFIGSEGGFSEKETQLFQSLGLSSVTLGAQVLRVETACVATISIIKYGFDLMR
jgi:16S rRNA (uracil1498-N3)-methyltransferase